jgi:uncharacterized membrane protein YraQ (UPF0718 family)
MNVSFAILVVLSVILIVVALSRGGVSLASTGVREGFDLLVSVAPQLLVGFLLSGLVTVLLPAQLVADLVGADSGFRGLVIATIAGIATPGGPFLQFPLVAAIVKSGAAIGPVAAYLTAWSLISANRALVWEVPVLGPSFTIARWGVSLLVPIFVGLSLPVVLRLMNR